MHFRQSNIVRVHFADIPKEGLQLNIDDESWFPGDEIILVGKPHARVDFTISRNRVFLQGRIKADIRLECDRCLDTFDAAQDIDFKMIIELCEKDACVPETSEHACSESEMDVVFVDEPVVDIYLVLRQQVFLALPYKKICREDCLGLCGKCGANLNRQPCDCHSETQDSPFNVLSRLKDDIQKK